MPQNLTKQQAIRQTLRVEFTLTKLQEKYPGQTRARDKLFRLMKLQFNKGAAK